MNHFTPRLVAVSTVLAMVIAGSTVASVGLQEYLQARDGAQGAHVVTAMVVQNSSDQVARLHARIDALLATAASEIANAEGKTLDRSAQGQVQAAMTELSGVTDQIAGAQQSLINSWRLANSQYESDSWWPPAAQADLASVSWSMDSPALATAEQKLTTALAQLTAARAAWQAEQDRIAAERAAAEAAAKAAAARRAAASSISASGGNTAPNAPTLQLAAAAPPPVVAPETVESYLSGLVSGASVTWNSALCQPNTICGTTTLSSSAPVITLDTDLRDYYLSTNPGKYVLVHEAAHARSWYRYGSTSELIRASIAVTGIPDNGGRNAVERMADCATVVKIGMVISTFTYLQGTTCSPAELAEAATYW